MDLGEPCTEVGRGGAGSAPSGGVSRCGSVCLDQRFGTIEPFAFPLAWPLEWPASDDVRRSFDAYDAYEDSDENDVRGFPSPWPPELPGRELGDAVGCGANSMLIPAARNPKLSAVLPLACVYALPGAVSGRREPIGALPTVYPRLRGGGCKGGGVVAGAGVARSVAIESGERPRNSACTSDPP